MNRAAIVTPLRVVELYSGIGGLHFAVEASGIAGEVIAAIDINTNANAVYKHNFPGTNLMQRNIEGLTVKDFEEFDADVIWMSPPCQPFTRVGLQKDTGDNRSASLIHVIELITGIRKKPELIMLENVKGFERSDARNILTEMLLNTGYNFQEFLLSPLDVAIPNSRLRYYLVAWIEQVSSAENEVKLLIEAPSFCSLHCVCRCHDLSTDGAQCSHVCSKSNKCLFCDLPVDETTGSSNDNGTALHEQRACAVPLQDYLHQPDAVQEASYLLSDKTLAKLATPLDIVYGTSTRSCCFTKAYGHYVKGTGSVYTQASPELVKEVYLKVTSLPEDDPHSLQLLKTLCLRYFTPAEVSLLMGFPKRFEFPSELTHRQRYKLLGNSLNVYIVTVLLKWAMERNQKIKN